MNSQSYKIKIRATVNGVTVVPTNIAWIHGNDSCLVTPCYKENDYIIVEIIPDCIGDNCIEGWIQFGSDCANCEPIYFKRCFCSSNDDCEECEDCNQYGICQSRCLVNEFCDDGECCNCNETTPCAGNKICNGCKCVCPQGTFEKNGICVECDENTVLDKCHICVNGVIVPIPCDGACDPATGQCVDCLTGGDCSSRLDGKTCCVDKVCVCCRGTVWDPILKMCVPQPCASDDECGPCEKCTPEGCKPIICPPNYKCIDGECVYWPCLSTSCENGADCGPECGCVVYEGVKQCVPCHILECLGLCEEALGCECKGTVCGPIDDCGSVYCDGTTPCLQPGCTCYNNRCVSCENFPCDPDDCTTRYNCGCIDGDCGAADCNDSIDLIKKENCSTDTGCELSAEYTSTKKCMCEAVEFRTKNTKTCTTAGVNGDGTATTSVSDILILKTELFKNNVPYADYLNQISMADNELVSGSITTTVSHYVKNNLGVFTQVNPSVTGVDVVSIIGNVVDDIKITTSNVKTNAFITELVNGTNVTTNRPTKVIIELRATNVKIDANDCKQYGTKVIATYELDYTTVSTVCAKINNYKTQQLAFLNDSKSIRKPFFVWHKSTTSTFSNTKYKTDGVYSNSGWFRKQFGSKVGDKWIDKINHPKRHVQGEFNELWNNLNYKVKVDCGCKANDATLQKVIFCCPKDFKYNATYDCGTKIIVDAFDTCAVNKHLGSLFSNAYNIPTQSQTYYWMIINGTTEISLRPAGGNLITPYTYTHTEPITSVAFEQRYIDTPLVATACPVSYVETPVLPEFNPVLSCDPTVIDVMKVSHPNLQSVTAQKISGLDAGPTIYPLAQQTSKFTTSTTTLTSPLRTVGSVKLTATFTNGCKTVKTIDITGNCSPVVTAVSAPSAISYANCVGGGSNPDIVAQPSGFGSNVEYSLDGVLFQSSPTFSNKAPGVYTVTARETIDGVLYTAVSAPVTITAAIQPTIGVSGSLCSGTTVTLTITGAPSSTFNFTLPNGTSSIITLNSLGIFEYTVTTATAGLYRATLSTNPTGVSCSPVVLEQLVGADGAHLTPTIILDGISCQGQPRRFRIDDGGANQTYTLTGINGTLSSPTVTASATFDNTFTPNTTISSVIAIVAIANNCYTFSTSFTTVPSTSAPMITSVASECVAFSPDKFEITVNTSSAATVSIGATTATTISSTQYKFYLFETAAGTDVVINATSGGCTYTTTHTLPTCSPDEGSIIVESNSPTCGQMNTTVDVTSVDFGYIIGEFYQWYEVIGGVDVAIGGTPGVIVSNVPSLTVFSTNSEKQYKVKIFKANGSIAESNIASVVAGNTFTPTIIGAPTVDTGASSNYYATPVADSYLWTLSNSQVVTPQVIGTESSVNILFTIPDNNIVSLTATTALCGSVTTSIPVVSTSNCAAMSVAITVPGSCDPNVFATVNTGGTGATVVSQTWTGTGIASSTYVGAAVISRSLSDLTTGQTVPDLTVSVTFSNGCVKTSTISYQRCTCYCTGTVCSISNTILSDTNIVVAVDDSSYGIDGTIFITDPIPIIYVDGDPLPGGPVINAGALPWDATNSALNNSRLNLSSVYNTTGKVSFRTLATGNADAVGFAADNGGTLTIAGDVIFSLSDPSISGNNTPFKKWWVIDYPVTAGDCIEYTAQNLGTISPTNPFAVGFETYSVNAVALAALGSVAAVNLVVVDSSRTLMGSTIAYGCPNGSAPTTGCTPICNCPTYPS